MLGSVNFSFSGPEFAENARQSFLLACLLIIGAQMEKEEEVLCGCTFGWKQALCRVELWLSTDEMPVLTAVANQFLSAMREYHSEVCVLTFAFYMCVVSFSYLSCLCALVVISFTEILPLAFHTIAKHSNREEINVLKWKK